MTKKLPNAFFIFWKSFTRLAIIFKGLAKFTPVMGIELVRLGDLNFIKSTFPLEPKVIKMLNLENEHPNITTTTKESAIKGQKPDMKPKGYLF